ncbi:probable l-serine dehydratase protein [Fulvimarina pelagi HTCC2506]|uniref:L-serine dehydratase n=2 Tax=Fulvimarina pelagi TaxID=217511 RepID=Q0FYF5_9HYPH|nr:L-serine ammonia-lyase [Fulvimarina pelagi]EAU40040.1 probable l-serine dehydratase protein [Fulvimarina pelagi HTCC2506]BAT31082.1 probable l-serine dehydratase protein [Fulvimarina pelagi]
MFISVFDIFKIGIGPSSSHTIGPMVAATRFLDEVRALTDGEVKPVRLRVRLHGSLAWTGKGHASDNAVCLGLLGEQADRIDPDDIQPRLEKLKVDKVVEVESLGQIAFDPATDLVFDYDTPREGHANGMTFEAYDAGGTRILRSIYYSVGGGFVMSEAELAASAERRKGGLEEGKKALGYPYPFGTAVEMLKMGREAKLTVAEMKRANEEIHLDRIALNYRLDQIWFAMRDCIDRGIAQEGQLPGGLRVKRRAKRIADRLRADEGRNQTQPYSKNDWLSVYAMAVNEENAAGGRVVTSPTNGAAGVVPAVIRYYRDHCIGANDEGIRIFLLTAAAIGALVKHNASISGAEVGCQGEVGSASAMAAAGLCAALGGTNEQIENAAEIALEHHLGMTCDPVNGLVQVPCIERNGFGAIKAVSAASLSLHGDGTHFMPLDNCIETMRQTGIDMSERYKETSRGGLAVNLPEC